MDGNAGKNKQILNIGPLNGIKVLDAAAVLAGPVTATILGDFGADVVKLEQPITGDFTRRRASERGGRSLQWVQEGRNKKSITLNLRLREGQELFRKMLAPFDVLIINYRPPTLKSWGLDLFELHRRYPKLIILSLTGYGMNGPLSGRGAFDRIASAYSGLTYTSGESDGPPVRSGYALIDYMGAYLGSFGVLLALYERDRNGGDGQIIDLALYEAGFRASEDALIDYSRNGVVRERHGNRNRNVVPAEDVVCEDGVRVAFHAGTDSLFARLTEVMGRKELADDPRFKGYHDRVRNQLVLYRIIEEWAATKNAETIEKELAEKGVPVSRLMTIEDIAKSEQYRSRESIVEVDDPEFGQVMMPGVFPKLLNTPGSIRSLGPELGSSNKQIYTEMFGLGEDEIAGLQERGVI